MHGYAFGLAIDISTAADIRICASNTQFCVKETAIGLAADIGTLSRLPYAGVSLSWAKDVCLTSRIFNAAEALRVGFVSEVLESKAVVLGAAVAKAKMVASLSPVAVQGTKHLIDYSLGRGVDEGLAYTASELFLFWEELGLRNMLTVVSSVEYGHAANRGPQKGNAVGLEEAGGYFREALKRCDLTSACWSSEMNLRNPSAP